ncbi:MAG: hypothetical protein NT165_04055 [Candidatus Falkowbacteria bacterium]|nr:hypothetical protein [Candidatus Falkowbacteria bacterium]
MFDYLQQFNRLSKELREAVSSPEAMKSLDEVEARHGIKLAAAVMRLMVKDLSLQKLPLFLASEFSLNEDEAGQIASELKNGVLKKVASYLGFAQVAAPTSFDDKITKTIDSGLVSFSSQNLVDRFRSISKTYLHGVRSKIDTRLAMQKSIETGGLGLSIELERKNKLLAEKELVSAPELKDFPRSEPQKDLPLLKNESKVPGNLPFAEPHQDEISNKTKIDGLEIKKTNKDEEIADPEEIAEFLKKISAEQEDVPVVPGPEKEVPAPSAPAPATMSASAPIAQPEKKLVGEGNVKISQIPKLVIPEVKNIQPLTPLVPPVVPVAEVPVVSDFQIIPTAQLIIPARPAGASAFKVASVVESQASNEQQGRTRMDDVRVAPQIIGPIEELRLLDLVNFRRLSPDPKEASNKILSKIKLLEKTGYDRMTAGIAAWRQSDTNRLYLKMCRESAFKAKPLADIIKSCQEQSEECLSQDEIDAVMSLNAKLIF